MLTILHTGDIHLGATLSKLGDKKEEQRVQIQRTFENIVNFAIDKQVDIFLIAGDLFDQMNPEKQLVDFVASNLARLNDKHIYTFISLGTHDFFDGSNGINSIDLSSLEYVKIFNNQDSNCIGIDELSLKVYCNCSLSNKSGNSPLAGISRDNGYRYNIAIAHGSIQIPGKSSQNDSPITLDEINNSGMDYIALGHWHNQQKIQTGNVEAWYCGAPEMIDLDQTNSGKILLIKIDDQNIVNVESINIGKREFTTQKINVGNLNNVEDLITLIRENINPNMIKIVELEGLSSLDFGRVNEEEIRLRLKDELFYLIIKDNSQVKITDLNFDEGNILMIKFVENIKTSGKDEKMIQDALQLGVMLLDGKTKVY